MSKVKTLLKQILRKLRHIFSKHYAFDAVAYSIADIKKIKKHPTALICEGVLIRNFSADLEIGENSQIGPYTVIFSGSKGVFIGKNVMIAPHCVIAAGNHNYRQLDKPMLFAGGVSKGPITIKDDVWIGANCTIVDGVTIGEGAVVGANSVITHDVAPFDIVVGVPGKRISNRKDK